MQIMIFVLQVDKLKAGPALPSLQQQQQHQPQQQQQQQQQQHQKYQKHQLLLPTSQPQKQPLQTHQKSISQQQQQPQLATPSAQHQLQPHKQHHAKPQQRQQQQQQQQQHQVSPIQAYVKKIAVVTPEPRQLAKRLKIFCDISKGDISSKFESHENSFSTNDILGEKSKIFCENGATGLPNIFS